MSKQSKQWNKLHKWIKDHNKTDLDHYKILKQALGILGMALPIVLIGGGILFAATGVQHSISHYYHTNMRDALVGLLAAVAIFLVTYQGYGLLDNLVSTLTGLAGAGVILFPCPTAPPSSFPVGIFQLSQDVSGVVHLVCAGAFFGLLALQTLVLFTVTDPATWGPKKKIRNIIYFVCGGIMAASLVILLVVSRAAPDFFANSEIGLAFEWIMLWAFGIAWIVKGGVWFLEDKAKPAAAKKRKAAAAARG
jgi:hypothetical protein